MNSHIVLTLHVVPRVTWALWLRYQPGTLGEVVAWGAADQIADDRLDQCALNNRKAAA